MKRIPQFEIAFESEPFALVSERGDDPARIEAEKREAEERRRAAEEFAKQHQITFA